MHFPFRYGFAAAWTSGQHNDGSSCGEEKIATLRCTGLNDPGASSDLRPSLNGRTGKSRPNTDLGSKFLKDSENP